jgi:hypothetical protein
MKRNLLALLLIIPIQALITASPTSAHMSFGGYIYGSASDSSYSDIINLVFASDGANPSDGATYANSKNHVNAHTGWGTPLIKFVNMNFKDHADTNPPGFHAQQAESGSCCIAVSRWHIRFFQGVDSDTSGWVGRYTIAAAHHDRNATCAYHVAERINEARDMVINSTRSGGHAVSTPGMWWWGRNQYVACDGTVYSNDPGINFVWMPTSSH